jgi:hypothetical protein
MQKLQPQIKTYHLMTLSSRLPNKMVTTDRPLNEAELRQIAKLQKILGTKVKS